MFNMPKGPFCQSCGIPMEKAEYGSNNDGSLNDIYCEYCFKSGEFTAPEITLDEMIKKVTGIMVNELNMPEFQAGIIAKMFLPKLKRWQKN